MILGHACFGEGSFIMGIAPETMRFDLLGKESGLPTGDSEPYRRVGIGVRDGGWGLDFPNAYCGHDPYGMNERIGAASLRMEAERLAKAIEEVNTAKNLIGSAAAGSMAFNAHFANMIGAIFLATGQDEAHVVEGSLGITTAEDRDGDLYFSVNMPDLPIATIGGGTRLETANEGLQIIDCAGSGKVNKFAEIVISTVMAGELSLIAAISAGNLAKAHQELGR